MCYYTITTEIENKEGHLQAIMIIDAEDEEMAKREYIKTFKLYEYKVEKGIRIENGFEELLTAPIKKFITKHKSGNSEGKLMSYCNSVHTKYDED
jgi:hypothetical protein